MLSNARGHSTRTPVCVLRLRTLLFQARSHRLNKEEAIPLPSPPLSLPLRSRTPPQIAARRSGGALKLPQRERAQSGRQTHLSHFGLSKKCRRSYNDEAIACSCINVATALQCIQNSVLLSSRAVNTAYSYRPSRQRIGRSAEQ